MHTFQLAHLLPSLFPQSTSWRYLQHSCHSFGSLTPLLRAHLLPLAPRWQLLRWCSRWPLSYLWAATVSVQDSSSALLKSLYFLFSPFTPVGRRTKNMRKAINQTPAGLFCAAAGSGPGERHNAEKKWKADTFHVNKDQPPAGIGIEIGRSLFPFLILSTFFYCFCVKPPFSLKGVQGSE